MQKVTVTSRSNYLYVLHVFSMLSAPILFVWLLLHVSVASLIQWGDADMVRAIVGVTSHSFFSAVYFLLFSLPLMPHIVASVLDITKPITHMTAKLVTKRIAFLACMFLYLFNLFETTSVLAGFSNGVPVVFKDIYVAHQHLGFVLLFWPCLILSVVHAGFHIRSALIDLGITVGHRSQKFFTILLQAAVLMLAVYSLFLAIWQFK